MSSSSGTRRSNAMHGESCAPSSCILFNFFLFAKLASVVSVDVMYMATIAMHMSMLARRMRIPEAISIVGTEVGFGA